MQSNFMDSCCNWQHYTFPVVPVVDYSMRALCASPYPGHKKGCPKLNTGHSGCPPMAPLFDKHFDIYSPIFVIVNEFDIKAHMDKLAKRNSHWTDRQLRCCLYWQATARKQLADKIKYVLALDEFAGYTSTTCPEAMGVNVTETLSVIGIMLEWPPVNVARQIAIVAKLINSANAIKPNGTTLSDEDESR